MLIAHLADLHLGYRAYHRMAPGGINQRERDVADAAARAVDAVIAARADLVLVAGDVFHTVRPSNGAIMAGFRLFARLRRGLPDAPVVLIAGNHDAPRSADAGSILRLLAEIPGVHVVDTAARAVRLERPDISVFCLPHPALVGDEPVALEPDASAGANVLMLHGTVAGTGVDEQLTRMVEYGGAHIERDALREDVWDYVALGHYHNATRIAPHVWYAGATERTATNIWVEAEARKGFVLYDTAARAGEFREIATRQVVELPRFSARRSGSGAAGAAGAAGRGGGQADGAAGRAGGGGEPEDGWLTAEEIDLRIQEGVSAVPGGVAEKIVRQVVTDIPRDLFRQLDHRRIRELKAEALHFQLDARRPDVRDRRDAGREAARRTLEEEVDAFLGAWVPTTPGIDPERLRDLGARYLASVAADQLELASGAGSLLDETDE